MDILIIPPNAIYRSPHRGDQRSITFEQFVHFVSKPIISEKKDVHGGMSLGLFRDGIRRLTHFVSTTTIGLDYDDGALTAEQIHQKIGNGRHVVYSTFSSTPQHPKSRTILFLDRAINDAEHKMMMAVLYKRAADAGITFDPSAKDASRWWYRPVCHPERTANHKVFFNGANSHTYAVDPILAQAPKPQPKPQPKPIPHDHADAYIRSAINKACDHIFQTPAGNRHFVLVSEAYSLARLHLTESEIAAALIPAFVSVSGKDREREAIRTVRDACKARGL
jgi:hypothetical protein